jgi:fructose-bisphosphate aldolase class 1
MNVSAVDIAETIKSQKGDRNLFLKVTGCIVYADGLDKTVTHHTPFSYVLELKDNIAYVTADTRAIDDGLLTLKQLTIYSGPAD